MLLVKSCNFKDTSILFVYINFMHFGTQASIGGRQQRTIVSQRDRKLVKILEESCPSSMV